MPIAAPLYCEHKSDSIAMNDVAFCVISLKDGDMSFQPNFPGGKDPSSHVSIMISSHLSESGLKHLSDSVANDVALLSKHVIFDSDTKECRTSSEAEAAYQSIADTCRRVSEDPSWKDEIIGADEALEKMNINDIWPPAAANISEASAAVVQRLAVDGKKAIGNMNMAIFNKVNAAAQGGVELSPSQEEFVNAERKKQDMDPLRRKPKPGVE